MDKISNSKLSENNIEKNVLLSKKNNDSQIASKLSNDINSKNKIEENNIQLPFNFSNKTLSITEITFKSQIAKLLDTIKDSRLYNFKQTLLTIPELTICLLNAHESEEFNLNIDKEYANDLVRLLRELLHQMFLEGDDFISCNLDECLNLCKLFEVVCTNK